MVVGAGPFDLRGGEERRVADGHGTSRRAVSSAPMATNPTAQSTSTSPPATGESRCESLDPLNASLAALGQELADLRIEVLDQRAREQ